MKTGFVNSNRVHVQIGFTPLSPGTGPHFEPLSPGTGPHIEPLSPGTGPH
jgi:hypothetical protein